MHKQSSVIDPEITIVVERPSPSEAAVVPMKKEHIVTVLFLLLLVDERQSNERFTYTYT
jgi:hypothetical protein